MEFHRGEMHQHNGHRHEKNAHESKHGHHHKDGDFLSRELNLTEEQNIRFENLRKEHFEKMKVNFDSMQVLKKEMLKNLGKSDAEANAIIQKIGALEMSIQKETFDHFNKMYAICTDSQKVELKEKLGNIMDHHGPGFGQKNRGGGEYGNSHEGKGGGKACCSPPPSRF
jgi:Spy/CpxP family protein refolding chaperone